MDSQAFFEIHSKFLVAWNNSSGILLGFLWDSLGILWLIHQSLLLSLMKNSLGKLLVSMRDPYVNHHMCDTPRDLVTWPKSLALNGLDIVKSSPVNNSKMELFNTWIFQNACFVIILALFNELCLKRWKGYYHDILLCSMWLMYP